MKSAIKQHYVATVYIYDAPSDEFLLLHHSKLGKWLPPGGHLDEWEIPHEGALREAEEEIGIRPRFMHSYSPFVIYNSTVTPLVRPFCILHECIPENEQEPEHWHIDFVYVAEIDRLRSLTITENEALGARWFAGSAIANLPTFDNVKAVCEAIRSGCVE